MKLVLLVVSVIAVFTADSRDIPVKPEDEILTEQSLGRDLHQELNNGSVLITDEPQGFNFTGVLPQFPGFNFTGILPPFPGFNFTGVHPPFTEEGEGPHEENIRATRCSDRYSRCSYWASVGYCSRIYTQWMSTNCPQSCNICDMYEVSFPNSGGIAKASDSLMHSIHGNFPPSNAFGGSGFWHSATHLPERKLLWYEFPGQIRVVKYSFKSRNDQLARPDGPSKYIFWASNYIDCSDETKWTKLYVDNSGTPFDHSNNPKSVSIQNNNFYRCYGFKVTDTPGRDGGKPVTISDVHYYEIRIAAPSGILNYMDGFQYEEIWNDKRSGGYHDVSIWRPSHLASGYCSLGDVASSSYSQPYFGSISVSGTPVKHPISFSQIWNDKGSGARLDCAVYRMNAPFGYTCLGGVAMQSHTAQPDKNRYCCILNDFVIPASTSLTYKDSGTGADEDMSLWKVTGVSGTRGISGNNFIPVNGYGRPSSAKVIDGQKATKVAK